MYVQLNLTHLQNDTLTTSNELYPSSIQLKIGTIHLKIRFNLLTIGVIQLNLSTFVHVSLNELYLSSIIYLQMNYTYL